jgi:hypothetical protein
MSVDTAGVRGPRNADGNLPDITFMRLAQGSLFVDAGVNIGLPYNGIAPDLGAFESSDISAPITVQLASFLAVHEGGPLVQLEWTTLSETNNEGFYVQRWGATDTSWNDIPNSFIPGHSTTSQTYQYALIDSNASIGLWNYRLKQVEVGGLMHFSDAISVNVLTKVKEYSVIVASYQLFQNYPNPFNPTTTIPFTVKEKGLVRVTVYNVLGQEMVTLFSGQAEPGKTYSIPFNAKSLPSGVYFSVLESSGKRQIKKMILMK